VLRTARSRFDRRVLGRLIVGLMCGCALGALGVELLAGAQPTSASAASVGAGLQGGSEAGSQPVAPLAVGRAVGQMLMTDITGLEPSPRLLARIRAGQVGNVILYSDNIASNSQLRSLDATLQRAAKEGGNPPLLIGTDQEGGEVKRVQDAPPTMSAQQMGAGANPAAVARRQGRATGEYLRRLGINVDFAPVSDIPTTANNFLHERAFGHSQARVIAGASGFAAGLAEAHIAGTAKHFPGLGDAGPRDTDDEVVTIDASKRSLQSAYKPYEAMSSLGSDVAPLVMVSNAIYPSLDRSGLPADLSPTIVQGQLALAGMGARVVITDDLEVPAVEQYSDAPVMAVKAGDDILMFAAREAGSEQAYREIKTAVGAGKLPRSLVSAAAQRVIELKQRVGLG
jgi:beta-N-acetylhexosaminidase